MKRERREGKKKVERYESGEKESTKGEKRE